MIDILHQKHQERPCIMINLKKTIRRETGACEIGTCKGKVIEKDKFGPNFIGKSFDGTKSIMNR